MGASRVLLPQAEGYEVPLERLMKLMAVYGPMEKELAQNQQGYLLQEVENPAGEGAVSDGKRRIRH